MCTYEEIEPLRQKIFLDSIIIKCADFVGARNRNDVHAINTEPLTKRVVGMDTLLMQPPIRAENTDRNPLASERHIRAIVYQYRQKCKVDIFCRVGTIARAMEEEMNMNDLPKSESVVASSNTRAIANALRSILAEAQGFTHSEPIYGASNSGRLLSLVANNTNIALPKPMTPEEIAHHLTCQLPDTRRNPPNLPGARKGWEVRQTIFGGRKAAIVWAIWIEP